MAQLIKNPPAMQETGLIPGLGRSSGEGKGYPLQYFWAGEFHPLQGFWPGEFVSRLILCSPGVAKIQMLCDFREYNWDISIGFSHVPILYFYDLTFLKQTFCIGHSDV